MYIHNTKNFQQKKFQKNCLFQQIRAMCVCVCMRVRMAAAALTQFFSDFFPWISGGGNKTTISKKKFFSTGEENSADHLHKQFFIGTRGGPAVNYLKKKNDRPTRNQTVKYPALKEIFNYSINLF